VQQQAHVHCAEYVELNGHICQSLTLISPSFSTVVLICWLRILMLKHSAIVDANVQHLIKLRTTLDTFCLIALQCRMTACVHYFNVFNFLSLLLSMEDRK